MRITKMRYLLFFGVPLILGGLFINPQSLASNDGADTHDGSNTQNTEYRNEDSSGPMVNNAVQSFQLSQVPSQMTGTGAAHNAAEYGVRTDSFNGLNILYNSTGGTTSTANLSVPLGDDWEGYKVLADIAGITENRTWNTNSGFLDNSSDWTLGVVGAGGSSTPYSVWEDDGHGTGDDNLHFRIDSNAGSPYFYYNNGDRAYARQTVTIPRGQVTDAWIRLNFSAETEDDYHYNMTGSFSIYVDIEGVRVWETVFEAIDEEDTWFDTGLVDISIAPFNLPGDQDVLLEVGLLCKASVGYNPEINPHARFDDIYLYVETSTSPNDITLEMNNERVLGSTNGIGNHTYTPLVPWSSGAAYANFSWTPSPDFPPIPNRDITVQFDVNVSVFARRLNVETFNVTGLWTTGDNFVAQNSSDIRWETNHYVSVPTSYASEYFFNISIPNNRDIDYVASKEDIHTNLTSGWNLGDLGDGVVNVSVYEITQANPVGFWVVGGFSPNMISNLEVWDGTGWASSEVFRVNEDTMFRATLSTTYENDIVSFMVYDPSDAIWIEMQATVDASGYAISDNMNLGAFNSTEGEWEVQAFVTDEVSNSIIHNVGFYSRNFQLERGTDMTVRYPIEAQSSWTHNVTYGQLVFIQVRVNDTDNGDLLPGGNLEYTWSPGTGLLSDLGTGEYSSTFDTTDLSSNGQFDITLNWTKTGHDPVVRIFTLNVIHTTELFSSDAPGTDIPLGFDAQFSLYFEDVLGQGITGATIQCNWSLSTYQVTPVGGSPGYYTLTMQTDSVALDMYAIEINASRDFFETRIIILSLQVRELHTSAIPSTSLLSLPVGYSTSFTITYTDTDHDQPITGAESAISCNWSDIHETGDQNYTVTETASPGVYEVAIFSKDTDILKDYQVVFNVRRYGAQNHTFTVTVQLRTHLTSFYLINPINPTPYTGNVTVYVTYYDLDTDSGIENGSSVGYNVLFEITSTGLPSVEFTVANGSNPGDYVIYIPASQWGDIGLQNLTIHSKWIGPTIKYSNESIDTDVMIGAAPTSVFVVENPDITPFGENASFSILYYDYGNNSGVVNGTGPYAGNVHLTIDVLTAGETISQADMMITEVDFGTSPGVYRIEFDTDFLSGLGTVEFRIWFNWTAGALPYYENQTILISVETTYRQAIVDWTPLPVTPYDELVNLTLVYQDLLLGTPILNSTQLTISVQEAIIYTLYYDGDATGVFNLELDTTSWTPGVHTFHVDVVWAGSPFYQNRTGVTVQITVRLRQTSLTHGSYGQVQYDSNLTLTFTYTDLDDFTSTGMDNSILSLDFWLDGHYDVFDNTDGTYTLVLKTNAFLLPGTYAINVTIEYGGLRYCENATDLFYLKITIRRAQLTSDVPELAPYFTNASLIVHYTDDNNGTGIDNAQIFAACSNSSQELVNGVNYWVNPLGDGDYRIRVSTVALGNFGRYRVIVTANWTGTPYYMERTTDVDVEVSRRPVSLTVTKSPLNTPFMANVTFELTSTDALNGSPVTLDKSVLVITHGGGFVLANSDYALSGADGVFTIGINSTLLVSSPTASYGIDVKFFWGDQQPFYSNVTTSTEVTITTRFTQAAVLSTPPAFYFFNISAVIEYSDYLTGNGIAQAELAVACANDTIIISGFIDNDDGTYEIQVNTTSLPSLGRFVFYVNISWSGTPYYQNLTNVLFAVEVNPVSTTLNFDLPEGVTYYLGDMVLGNITYNTIFGNQGVTGATIATNWFELYGTDITTLELGDGVYRIQINTSGLDAQRYTFDLNASKPLYVQRSVTADIILAAIPIEIALLIDPTDPTWGDSVTLTANITDARNGNPIDGATVEATISSLVILMGPLGGGIYETAIQTTDFTSGEQTITVKSTLLNHETREKDFQLRVEKVSALISASATPQVSVNGQNVTLEVDYVIRSNGTSISTGEITFSWEGGIGVVEWNAGLSKYSGRFNYSNVPEGTYQILVRASSDNYKTVTTIVTIEVVKAIAELTTLDKETSITVTSGHVVNVTIYLNNTDLNKPVTGATVTFTFAELLGNMTELGNGYYTAQIPTAGREIRDHLLTVSSVADGYTPYTIQITLTIQKIATDVLIVEGGNATFIFGQIATFTLRYIETNTTDGIANATATFTLASMTGNLTDLGNGTYSFTLNTTTVSPGSVSHDINIVFQKTSYDYGFTIVKLLVRPIPTKVMGPLEELGEIIVRVPVGDDFRQLFNFTVDNPGSPYHSEMVSGATATAIWDLGPDPLTDLSNGWYAFGFAEANLSRLEVGEYTIRISISKANYMPSQITIRLIIELIATETDFRLSAPNVYVGDVFSITVTLTDTNHDVGIEGATITVTSPTLILQDEVRGPDGTYTFVFEVPGPWAARHDVTIELTRADYDTEPLVITIYSVYTDEQMTIYSAFQWGAIGLIGLSGLGAGYVRVWSVPKPIRRIASMLKKLRAGRVPEPAPVPDRRGAILAFMNEDLEPVNITKTMDDVTISTLDVSILDMEQLLVELTEVIGLTEQDVAVLRADLERMRPSERAGFIGEVLRQEKARRAKELADERVVAEERPPEVEPEVALTEEELEDVRQRLLDLGIAPDEVEIMVEQAKTLSKAEIDALLEQLGGMGE